MKSFNIFIVEDDQWYGEILEYHLSLNPDYLITRFTTGKECLDNLYKQPDLITIDFSLPDFKGDKLYQKIREYNNNIPVIVISGQEDIAVAVEMLKMGVTDYILKDDNTKDLLWNAAVNIREKSELKEEVYTLRKELKNKYAFKNLIIGQSKGIENTYSLIEKASKTNINVSVTGETGTGKELVAKAIHYNSEREKKKFVAVNMAAIPKELIESELFGHERGAFTGAMARKAGKFEEANGGTIFLDEIGELDLSMQSKLLRVLQEREVVRVGGNETVKIDARVITATHKNLAEEVKKGNFREDLFYRLFGMPIELPPLRQRGNDILILAKHFAENFATENKMPTITISAPAREKLISYNYPGNVRELKAMIELAMVMSDGIEIKADDITFPSAGGAEDFMANEKSLRQYTCDIIKYYLDKYDNDVVEVAEKLDIGKSTIYKMIQQKEIAL